MRRDARGGTLPSLRRREIRQVRRGNGFSLMQNRERRDAAAPAALRDSAGPLGERFFADAEPRAAGRCCPCGAERFSKAAEKVCFPLLKRRKQQ